MLQNLILSKIKGWKYHSVEIINEEIAKPKTLFESEHEGVILVGGAIVDNPDTKFLFEMAEIKFELTPREAFDLYKNVMPSDFPYTTSDPTATDGNYNVKFASLDNPLPIPYKPIKLSIIPPDNQKVLLKRFLFVYAYIYDLERFKQDLKELLGINDLLRELSLYRQTISILKPEVVEVIREWLR